MSRALNCKVTMQMYKKFFKSELLQNFSKFDKVQRAAINYQFKKEIPIYYPNRENEKKRNTEQEKKQLVAEINDGKRLPKDYYYKILGLKKYATTQQIKAAYYAMAKRFHPDAATNVLPHESKRFQEISNAYHILSDESKRMEYDQLGIVSDVKSFLRTVGTTNANRKHDQSQQSTEDLIKITGGESRLELTFMEAVHGIKKNIDLRFVKKCPACNGRSPQLVSRSKSVVCRKCQGKGQVYNKTPTYTILKTCDACNGKCYINRNECEICDNRGTVVETTRVIVQVPVGIKSGETLVVENPKTKALVNYRVQVLNSDTYERVGNNIVSDKYLTISEAVLGGIFKIRGIYETFEIRVEPGTESHTQITMKGKGIKGHESTGDHIITIKIRIPRQLNVKQRQLILALAQVENPTFDETF